MAETGKQNLVPGIKDKVVVITGASSGIGEATAVMLAERGAKVVLGTMPPPFQQPSCVLPSRFEAQSTRADLDEKSLSQDSQGISKISN